LVIYRNDNFLTSKTNIKPATVFVPRQSCNGKPEKLHLLEEGLAILLMRCFEFALQGEHYIGIKSLNGNICHFWYR